LPDPLNQDFSRQTKHHWNWARARASTRASTGAWARVFGAFHPHSRRRAKRGG